MTSESSPAQWCNLPVLEGTQENTSLQTQKLGVAADHVRFYLYQPVYPRTQDPRSDQSLSCILAEGVTVAGTCAIGLPVDAQSVLLASEEISLCQQEVPQLYL
jgi:hypothetical protein|mmetsp:Transcript_1319/g.2494  ORF Transcript_1319/g.2494 Transcript_1319/m.2494 type:complete len:103 (+) Transcript_1319:3353-3661(+)